MELRQLKPAVAVRGPHHGDVDTDVVEPDDTVHPASLDRRFALQLHTKFDKERSSSLKVVDNDADVVHPLNGQIPEHRGGCLAVSVRGGVVCSWISATATKFFSSRSARTWNNGSPPPTPPTQDPGVRRGQEGQRP